MDKLQCCFDTIQNGLNLLLLTAYRQRYLATRRALSGDLFANGSELATDLFNASKQRCVQVGSFLRGLHIGTLLDENCCCKPALLVQYHRHFEPLERKRQRTDRTPRRFRGVKTPLASARSWSAV